jgi:hypothetical protein
MADEHARTVDGKDSASAHPKTASHERAVLHTVPSPVVSQAPDAPNGLTLPRNLAFERWLHIGAQLAALADRSAWCLGNWLVYGENAYSGRYRDAIQMTSLNYQTLRNYAWVARAFPMSRRRPRLSFAHHAELAGLSEPEQEYWLRKADELGWSCRELRHQVRASLKERDRQIGPGDDGRTGKPGQARTGRDGPRSVELPMSQEQLLMCERAAGLCGLPLNLWAVMALEDAAHRTLRSRD